VQLTVFGATGRVGGQIVRQALAAGHEVTAVVRHLGTLSLTDDRLQVVVVPSLDVAEDGADRLRAAVAGADGVLSALGPRRRKDAGVTAALTTRIVETMEETSTRRLVAISAAPVGPVPEGESFVMSRIGFPLVRAALRAHYRDLAEMERILAGSRLEWTVVRPPRFTDRPLTARYRTVIGANVCRGATIGRQDLAHAMLALVGDAAAGRQCVGVAY
jgi:putative NADH-flavin reductase